jgi:hypothetical protein
MYTGHAWPSPWVHARQHLPAKLQVTRPHAITLGKHLGLLERTQQGRPSSDAQQGMLACSRGLTQHTPGWHRHRWQLLAAHDPHSSCHEGHNPAGSAAMHWCCCSVTPHAAAASHLLLQPAPPPLPGKPAGC